MNAPARGERQAERRDDDGELLVELPRGETDRLRLMRRSYEGREYLDLRVWFVGSDGKLRPTKKGTSIRLGRELRELAQALSAAAGEQRGGERR